MICAAARRASLSGPRDTWFFRPLLYQLSYLGEDLILIGDARRRSRAKYSNGLEHYSRGPEQWVCAIERDVDETIALWGQYRNP